MEKKEVEELLKMEIPDSLFQRVLGYAERKQRYIYNQTQEQTVMQNWYLVKLAEEYVRSFAFSEFTMCVCRELKGMEKEHSAKSQSAPRNIHIVACPASESNKNLQYGGKFL
ncbi:hypothetical protein D7V94_13670 [Parablautia intestinalis]|uniref:Uncharacterized protein n=1 Tax=Parablautia intestinalis TaxID=2320100 RepID=A0A3A9ASB2_9FIRM|nr:hypothetical protein [Parablautia intestinalis]RKI90471.1 hypothetical protein D7V94_13670 [Parablautia intestinalis]